MPNMENVIKGLEECIGNGNCTKCQYGSAKQALSCKKLLVDALVMLKEQEAKIEQLNRFINGFSRDAIPVVRCKDCKHGQLINGEIWCSAYVPNTLVSPDWFCADGVKKDE